MIHIISRRTAGPLTAVAVIGLAAAFSSCKGRTADNMVPTGETVEVAIPSDTTDTIAGFSAPADPSDSSAAAL